MEQLDVIFQTFQGAPSAVERRDPEAHRTSTLMEFMKLKPPMFEGSSEHVVAERWLKAVKEMFDNLKVPQEYRVGFAIYLFEGLVEEWWDLHMYNYDVSNLCWDVFETLFREKYIPGTHSEPLVQGDMTVAQYHARFLELFDRDLTAMVEPDLRCMKFKEGLRPKIRSKLDPLPLTDFSVMVAAALLTESDLIGNHGGKNGTLVAEKKIDKIDKLLGPINVPIRERYRPYSCHNCGLEGHVRRDCPRKLARLALASGDQQGSEINSASLGALNCPTQPAPDQNSSGSEKDQLQGQSSKGSDATKRNKSSQPRFSCHNCQEKGHIKRNCPMWKQQSLASGGQKKSQFYPASSDAHNSQTQPAPYKNALPSFAAASQPFGLLPPYYCQMQSQVSGFQQSKNGSLTPQQSGSQSGPDSSCADNIHRRPAPYKYPPISKKPKLQAQNSQGGDTHGGNGSSWVSGSSGRSRLQPSTCYICHQIGHIQRNCPYV